MIITMHFDGTWRWMVHNGNKVFSDQTGQANLTRFQKLMNFTDPEWSAH